MFYLIESYIQVAIVNTYSTAKENLVFALYMQTGNKVKPKNHSQGHKKPLKETGGQHGTDNQ